MSIFLQRSVLQIIFRRDKEFCHECRYCCTLSICTKEDGTYFKKSKSKFEYSKAEGKIDAYVGYSVDQRMYKKNDFRCLKPSNTTETEKWTYYEMKGFREAKSKEELNNVKEIQYDKYFFNFENPNVMKEMSKKEKLWKKTYGFDFVMINHNKQRPTSSYQCLRYCYKAENRIFAKRCKQDNGLFKCC